MRFMAPGSWTLDVFFLMKVSYLSVFPFPGFGGPVPVDAWLPSGRCEAAVPFGVPTTWW